MILYVIICGFKPEMFPAPYFQQSMLLKPEALSAAAADLYTPSVCESSLCILKSPGSSLSRDWLTQPLGVKQCVLHWQCHPCPRSLVIFRLQPHLISQLQHFWSFFEFRSPDLYGDTKFHMYMDSHRPKAREFLFLIRLVFLSQGFFLALIISCI